ncbi:MAG: hypothetical protein K2K53_12605, partial [Oscillospiraceae bacterium]|nr:hypothetical protein [Oscillospiraceae bacterium]
MDFLEAAAVLVPGLTGLSMTLYGGEKDVLERFERQYCFSPRLQAAYTAAQLGPFLEKGSDALIYDIQEPLGSRLAAFRAGERWALLGPYVEEGWNGAAARTALARLGASEAMVPPYKAYRCKLPISGREYALDAAALVALSLDGDRPARAVPALRTQAGEGDALAYPSDYESSAIVNRRYALEERLLQAVGRGDREAALAALSGMQE